MLNLQVIQGLTSFVQIDFYPGMLILDTRSTLAKFDSWSIQRTKRTNNTMAHALGKDALGINDSIMHCIGGNSFMYSISFIEQYE